MNTDDLADLVIKVLKSAGIVIQRYDAYSTNSIYLKLDYGVANSLRISDHKTKKDLAYRYNLLTNIKHQYDYKHRNTKHKRYFYPAEDVYALIRKIIADRDRKIQVYGENKYRNYMLKNKRENADSKGFWREAVIV